MALDQNITTLLSTALGGLLAITGGFLATSFSQRMTEKAQKRQLTRQKIEALYILSDQVREWAKVQVLRACEMAEITLSRKAPSWFFDAVKTEPECPIERMEMLAYLYLPQVAEPFKSYRKSVLAIQYLEVAMRNNHYSKDELKAHCEANLVRTPDVEERLKTETKVVVEFVVQILDNFERSQEHLHIALQQVAMKS